MLKLTMAIFLLDVISILAIVVGGLLSPSSISKKMLEQSGGRETDILNIPQMWQREWFSENRIWVLHLNRLGSIGVCVFSLSLYFILSE